MTIRELLDEIGDDIDLLARSDQWLEAERIATATNLNEMAKELSAIYKAQRIKRALQQRNLVAVQMLEKTDDGDVQDIAIRIMPIPDAISYLKNNNTCTLDSINYAAQLNGWNSDGYDITTSIALRQ